ncbi:hypothetical protein Q31b_19520 [Novipirellula aureliae]|uniref:Uncharacterized protein n=1 Tax=Novipirellula aureliae TaxID=2527966 RepID=A0A5C6EAA3_9BACT|nr:hypothetical protein Q31b_19520 [Novipirellula aureliae]
MLLGVPPTVRTAENGVVSCDMLAYIRDNHLTGMPYSRPADLIV